jgi:hypothetical protein
MMPISFQHSAVLNPCPLLSTEKLSSSSATKGELINLSNIFLIFFYCLPNMFNDQSISGKAQSTSPDHGNDDDYNLITRMGGETTPAAFLQESSLWNNRTDLRTLGAVPFHQPDHPSLMSLHGGALGFLSLSSWPTQSGVPSLTDHHHHQGWEAASSPASLERISCIMSDVMAILDADDTVIARITNTSDITHMRDDDSFKLDFSSRSGNMPPARQ